MVNLLVVRRALYSELYFASRDRVDRLMPTQQIAAPSAWLRTGVQRGIAETCTCLREVDIQLGFTATYLDNPSDLFSEISHGKRVSATWNSRKTETSIPLRNDEERARGHQDSCRHLLVDIAGDAVIPDMFERMVVGAPKDRHRHVDERRTIAVNYVNIV